MKALIFLALFVGGAVLPVPATGEDAANVPPVGAVSPGWLQWSMNISSQPPRSSGLDQAEFDRLKRKMGELGAFFRRTPYLRSPPQAEIRPTLTILNRVGAAKGRLGVDISRDKLLPARHPLKDGAGWENKNGPVRAELRLSIYRPEYHRRNPNCSIRVQINDPWMEGRWIFEDDEGGVYLAWPLLEESQRREGRLNIKQYQLEDGVVLEKLLLPGREPWLPVSQERWIRLLIDRSKGDLEDYRMKINSIADERYARIAAAIEDEDYDQLESLGDRGRAMLGRHTQALEAELAGLSPAERAAPAYGFEFPPAMYWMPRRPPQRPSLLLDADDPAAAALVTPNPQFFRTDLPAERLQSITIVNALWEEFAERLEHELDYRGLAVLLD